MTTPHFHSNLGKQVIVSQFGENPLDALEKYTSLREQQRPDPAQLAPDEVIVDIQSASVGWVDLLMMSGQYQHMPAPPYCPGLEFSGVVSWVGKEVSGAQAAVGDRVIVDPFLVGPRAHGKYQVYGGFASYAVAPANAIIRIPETLTLDQACCLLGNYETAYHCLITRGKLKAGETVLIHGATGAVGLAAVHIAQLIGATVIATGRSPEKLAVVKEQGADHVISTTDQSLREEVKRLTDHHGVDVVYDGVGGDISALSLRCVKFGARFLIVGWASTPDVANGKGQRGSPRANTLPTNLIMMKGMDVLGCPTVISTHHDPSIRKTRLTEIMNWVKEGKIKPLVSRVYPLSDYKQAMLDKWNSEAVGGYVLQAGVNFGG